MRRFVPLLIAGVALIVAACRDVASPNHQTLAARRFESPRNFSLVVSESDDSNAVTITFEIAPEGGQARIGDMTLDYPANAVCDPATSGYGPAFWLSPCATLNEPITITARFWFSDGRHRVEFSPDIRFSPDKEVILSVMRPAIKGRTLSAWDAWEYNFWYAERIGTTDYYIDEAWSDPDLMTQFDTTTGKVYRRIRHFTYYNVRTGEACDETVGDPECVEGGGQ